MLLSVDGQSAKSVISTKVHIYIYIERFSISLCNFLHSESCITSQRKRRTGA